MRSSGNTIATLALLGMLTAGASAQSRETATSRAPRPVSTTGVSTQPATLTGIKRDVLPDTVRITLTLDVETPFTSKSLVQPSRIVIDLERTRTLYALKDTNLTFTDVVKQIRVGRQPDSSTRVVLDLASVATASVYPIYNPYRLVIDVPRPGARERKPINPSGIASASNASAPTGPSAPAAKNAASGAGAGARTSTTPASSSAGKAPASSASGRTAGASSAGREASRRIAPAPPSANTRGGFSLSRQLGLGISRVVIDAGHGGHDPGARSNGITEAELALDIALRLEKRLQDQGIEVVLTRRTSVFIALEERTAIANQSGADLFLSIHANASENASARGIETYFLNFAPDDAAEAIAARENAGSSQKMRSLPEIVRSITMNDKIDESRDLARFVQEGLFRSLRKSNRQAKDLGVKQAPFQVLIGAAMPSILAEISFITNTQESTLLKTDKYRDQIADALFSGVMAYQQSLKKDGTVAER